MTALLDTNALFALANAADTDHDRVRDYITSTDDILIVPITVLPEIDYLIAKYLGIQVQIAMLRDVVAGEFTLEPVLVEDVARAIDLMEQYADADIGFVDASIVAVAERRAITRIVTGDQHFRMFRPRHCIAFALLP